MRVAHRKADEDVHHAKCALALLEIEQEVGEGPRLRRFSISGLIHGLAIKTSRRECFVETKQYLFRSAVPVSEERDRMRTRLCGEKSKRGRVGSDDYFLDAIA